VTIAACYLSSEGVVFGADSATTIRVAGRGAGAGTLERHFEYAQKVFEVGTDSTLGIVTWGMGNLEGISYRTLIAQFADALVHQPALSVADAAGRWNDFFRAAYSRESAPQLQPTQQLLARQTRTTEEQTELDSLHEALSGGFCLGGYLRQDRLPGAFTMSFRPDLTAPEPPEVVEAGVPHFRGFSNLMERLVYGIDRQALNMILRSGKYTGTREDLVALLAPGMLSQPRTLPIRDAIDWIHACVYTTVKATRFSHLAPTCGGPIDVAVITTDRPFRWVRQKAPDAALSGRGSHE
jgi:hypothetical protein